MNRRRFAAFLTVSAVASLMPVAASGQAATAPLRTPWGQPDLRGIWDFRTITPLQRPEDLAEREFLTAEQAADVEERTLQRRAENDRFIPGRVGAYNQFWLDQGTDVIADRRTALIVDPPNGRIPPLTPAGETRREARRVGTDSWENRRMGDRCLFASMPMIPDAYNNNVQLFQTPDYVALLHEMGNTTRIVPLDRRRRTGIRQWMGESARTLGGRHVGRRDDSLRPPSGARLSAQPDPESGEPPRTHVWSNASRASALAPSSTNSPWKIPRPMRDRGPPRSR